jgi:F1F0 ATPase subunit 2
VARSALACPIFLGDHAADRGIGGRLRHRLASHPGGSMNVLISFTGGILIGILFYGGLWFTVQALLVTRHPALLAISSFWARTVIALFGFLFLMDGKWHNALACLAGFALGRVLWSIFVRHTGGSPRCT